MNRKNFPIASKQGSMMKVLIPDKVFEQVSKIKVHSRGMTLAKKTHNPHGSAQITMQTFSKAVLSSMLSHSHIELSESTNNGMGQTTTQLG